ncbi:hypothetical protein K474DRAFT_1658791 [Panus rudis PR-1116 ss-1]|nr:hypothetical protein K474DRAFT_1658791 [Panus rudis PR-1116 ss-1]
MVPSPTDDAGNGASDFLSNILTPGSAFHPTFQLILDVGFAMLFMVLLGMAVLTGGNMHVLILIGIEACLWASVKWFVRELQKVQPSTAADVGKAKKQE